MSEIEERELRLTRLREAGRYDEALALLQELFAEAAHADVPARQALFIVMLEWQFLIEVHEAARAALAAARDAQVASLLAGDLFFDQGGEDAAEIPEYRRQPRFELIIRMNDILRDGRATHAMFLQVEAVLPEVARRRAWLALPAIVEAGDFGLADRYRGEPLAMLKPVNETAAHWPLLPPYRKAPRLAAEMMNLTRDVRIAIAVLVGLGRPEEADTLRKALLAGLVSDELRDVARRELDTAGTINRMLVEHQMAQEAPAP